MPSQKDSAFARTLDREREDITLPSGRKVTVLESTGREERLLSRLENNKNFDVINDFLAMCTEGLDGKSGHPLSKEIKKMLTGDRTTILLYIRKLTHGVVVEHKHTCSNCNAKSDHEVSIDESLKTMKPYPKGDQREFEVSVGPGIIHFEPSNGETEAKIAREDVPDINTKLRCMRMWEETESGKLPVDIDQLKSKWIVDIRRAVKSAECVLDTTMNIKCPHCGTINRLDMVGDLDFLFPHSM